MTDIRVLHVVLTLCPGGAERLVLDLCRELRPFAASAVCCLDDPGPWADQARALGTPVSALGRRPGFRPGLGWRISRLARAMGATVLHCHQYSPFVYGTIAGLLQPGLRIVYTEHGRVTDAPPSSRRTWANRLLGFRPERIVAVCDDLRRFMSTEGFPASRIEVIHNGIDPRLETEAADVVRARRAIGLPADVRVVGTVARLDPVKRLDVLIEACALVRRIAPGTVLVVVGDGPTRASLERLAVERGLGDSVRFLGARDDARALVPAFDVYVNSSASEGVSLTVLEAMAAGLPVVATHVGGTPEVLTSGVTGLLVPPDSAGAIAEAVLGLLDRPDDRARLGAAARARVVHDFSLDEMVRRYLAAYRA